MLIRYPGSKDKHIKFLKDYLLEAAERNPHIVEPFAGTASITFYLLEQKKIESYHINDFDESMASLWRVVKNDPDYLINRIHDYTPNVPDFYLFKSEPGEGDKERAFRKLALHQMSYSGLGAMAGGPLGGREQKSAYGIDCRWRPNTLEKNIKKCSVLLNSVPGEITAHSWEEVVETDEAKNKFIYLDPPYYVKGAELYQAGTIDHERLAASLKSLSEWVLSYDDAPEVRSLYSWANVRKLDVTSHLHHSKISDLVITP